MDGLDHTDKVEVPTARSLRMARSRSDAITCETRKIVLSEINPSNIAADSHVGFARTLNEDSYAYLAADDGKIVMAAVADGIGGHENGDIASNLSIKMLLSAWRRELAKQDPTTPDDALKFFKIQLEIINAAVYMINDTYNVAYPMGTTIAAGIFLSDAVIIAHAGDSRVYRLRDKNLTRLTQDHSFVNNLIQKGTLTEEDALTHPFAHVITKSIGPTAELNPEIKVYERYIGDRYLLCTDGLNLHASDPEIQQILYDAYEPAEAVKNLMNLALKKGGGDNTTIICVFG